MYSSIIRKIIGFTLGLMLVLILIRVKVLGMNYYVTLTSPNRMLKLISASHYDLIYALGIGAVFTGMAFLFRNRAKMLSALSWTFIGLAVLNVFFALANVKLVRMLGVPFNYQWMYYSDMLGNSEAARAVAENLSLKLLMNFLLLSGLLAGVGYVLEYVLTRLSRYERYYRRALWGMAAFFLLYFVAARYYTSAIRVDYSKMANPVVAFAESVLVSFVSEPDLFSVTLPETFEAFPVRQASGPAYYHAPAHEKVRNVVLFVLESVPSAYVSGYTDKYKATPVIEQHLSQSMVFSDIYAHSPSTNNTLVSLLGSIYPMISYKSISAEHPRINWPTLSSELKKSDYRTGFFFASDNRFQKMDEFLSGRQFDKIEDYRSMPCKQDILATEWENLDGVDEACMIDAFTDWLKEDIAQQPFFATLWTMQTHYPYFASGPEKDYGVNDPLFNRYLNALHHSDAMLGKMLDELEQRGLAESTLVVVVGDHGEAFLQHYQYGHASHIYEENVKVPLMLINPLLFSGERQSVIGGHIDIGPTIMDILRMPSPAEWQGISLFDTTRTNRAYFFSPWSDYLFGYRTPTYKVIFDATHHKTMVFELDKDPGELHNLADQMPEFVDLSHRRLARWVQYHTAVLRERVSAPAAQVSRSQAATSQ